MSEENLKEKILEEMQQGRICYRTIEGVFSATQETADPEPETPSGGGDNNGGGGTTGGELEG